MSVGNPVYRRFHQNNWNFCLILAEQMIAFKDERTVNLVAQANQNSTFDVANHSPHAMPEKIGAAAGWRMEERLSELAEILGTSEDSVKRRKCLFSTRTLACCSCDYYSLVAHSAHVHSNNFIFKHTELQGLMFK